ncbi:hypothetical protein A9Q84_04405 [Halobacteriovorax marinus]|uniref:CMP/dCMP-type deaminase domain-containing protein n=1 Tax=Halobacteriovorax marinus TaxID=97084 RepID=A0A1Y5FH59_9BACT|nr:hypothetical protein A9Q84_04405 [Halobacteriovorax marinus]
MKRTETNNEINYIPVKSPLAWDEYFMLQAMMASFKSKDPSTKVGAVFVDENNHQVTMGYNGFVAGIDEEKLPWGKDPAAPLEFQKYGYVVHAEANAILHSKENLKGTKAYVTLFPCHECAKLLASSKVNEVIYLSDKHCETESNRISKKIFELAGIKYRQLEIKDTIINEMHKHFQVLLEQVL